MKRIIPFFILFIITSSSFSSCDITHEEGVYYYYKDMYDFSQKNKFDASLFFNDWILTKVYYDTYRDGELVVREDITDDTPTEKWSFVARTELLCGDREGYWEYHYNYLYQDIATPYMREVLDLTTDVMILKGEELRSPTSTTFLQNKQGIHRFFVWEFHPKHEEDK